MDFSSALVMLKEGYKIKRKHWGGYWFMAHMEIGSFVESYDEVAIFCNTDEEIYPDVKANFFMIVAKLKEGGYAPAQAYQEDLLSSDWEVVE